MKSAFGSKRKARKIRVEEDEEDSPDASSHSDSVNTGKWLITAAINQADYERLADVVRVEISSSGLKA